MSEIVVNLKAPWPWYVAGTMIGLIVPILLIIGNKIDLLEDKENSIDFINNLIKKDYLKKSLDAELI